MTTSSGAARVATQVAIPASANAPAAKPATTSYVTPVIQFTRTAVVETEVGGQQLVPGDRVVMVYSSANRDERAFTEPDKVDIGRQPKRVRAAFTKALKEALEILAGLVPGEAAPRRYDDAITLFSGMVGALILARAVSEESLSRRILETAANRLSAADK